MKRENSPESASNQTGNMRPDYEENQKNIPTYQDTVKDLNAKILKLTTIIREQYPELVKYLEEMPETLPNEPHPDSVLENLKKYYESLTTMLEKYKLEHYYKTNSKT